MTAAYKISPEEFSESEFRRSGELFFTGLWLELSRLGLNELIRAPDHLCFRVASESEYRRFKAVFSSLGDVLCESMVRGRPITTIRLHHPLTACGLEIGLIELPAPKPGRPYSTGFEHAEFVVNRSFGDIKEEFTNFDFTESEAKALNSELVIETAAGVAKFHHLSLNRVIEIERARISDIIFDLDGTLIDSRERIHEINREVFSRILERDVLADEARAKFHSEFPKLFDAFEVTCPIQKNEALSLWASVSTGHRYAFFPGAVELIRALRSDGRYRLHLWTARDEFSARAILEKLAIEDVFATLSFAGDLGSKPNAMSLKFEAISARPHSVLMIGDSTTDVLAAQNVGAIAAAALWDSAVTQRTLVEAGAEVFFASPDELSRWLLRDLHI